MAFDGALAYVHARNHSRDNAPLNLRRDFKDRVGTGAADEVPGQGFFPIWSDPRITGMDPFYSCSGRFRTFYVGLGTSQNLRFAWCPAQLSLIRRKYSASQRLVNSTTAFFHKVDTNSQTAYGNLDTVGNKRSTSSPDTTSKIHTSGSIEV